MGMDLTYSLSSIMTVSAGYILVAPCFFNASRSPGLIENASVSTISLMMPYFIWRFRKGMAAGMICYYNVCILFLYFIGPFFTMSMLYSPIRNTWFLVLLGFAGIMVTASNCDSAKSE